MAMAKRNIVFIAFVWLSCFVCMPVCAQASIGMKALSDSLTAYVGFSPVWSPRVRVKNMRVDGNHVTLQTNVTLSHVAWTPETIHDIKHRVSRWVLGKEDGIIKIFSAKVELNDWLTDRARGIIQEGEQADLTEKNIALWPSHGLYFNTERQEWIWQRATLWTTVEDLYSQEYVRLIRTMLENAGATIHMPRAGLEHTELGPSNMPRWTEGARYWLISQGEDSTIWNLYNGDEYKDDMKCRAMWVNSLDVPIDLCLALHTDGLDSGNDTTIIGTLCIYTARDDEGNATLRDGRDREKTNRNLGDWIQTQIISDLRHITPKWTRRQLQEANYCEARVPVVPSVLIELLSHKNMADMRYGLDPRFRFTAARAIYKGILRYTNGNSAVVQPLPVQQTGIDINGVLHWIAPIDSLEPSATPTYYMVYIQQEDGEWEVQQVENTTHFDLNMQRGIRYNCYVVAGNEGGLSFPGPTVSAYRSEIDNTPTALIIDGFNDVYPPEWFIDSTYAGIIPGSYACEDHISCAYIGQQWDFRRSSKWINDDNCGWGDCFRDHAGQITIGNTRDYSVLHGRVLRKMRISYVSSTPAILSDIHATMSSFTFVDYICGRQRDPIDTALMTPLTRYLSTDGQLLISTDHYSAIHPQWAKQNLHASFYAPNATRSGRVTSFLHRLYQLQMKPNEEQLFTPSPQGLKPEGEGAFRIAEYTDKKCGAAIAWTNRQRDGKNSILVWGFPLEACTEFDKIYRHSIEWLLKK